MECTVSLHMHNPSVGFVNDFMEIQASVHHKTTPFNGVIESVAEGESAYALTAEIFTVVAYINQQGVNQIWQRYGQAAVDLFTLQENTQCPLYFSLADENAPLGVDVLAHPWPDVLLYVFPPLSLISPTLARACY